MVNQLSHHFPAACSAAIRERRLELGLNQEEVSERAGLARSYICDVERGARNPSLHNLSLIATALDMSTSELIQDTEIRLAQLVNPANLAEAQQGLEGEFLRYMQSRMSLGVIICRDNGDFVLFNEAARRILGIGSTDGPVERWSDTYGCFRPDRVTRFPSHELPLARALAGEKAKAEIFISNRFLQNGGRSIEVTARPLLDSEGQLRGGLCYFNALS